MINTSELSELIQQLQTLIYDIDIKRATNPNVNELRLVNKTIHNLKKMGLEIPDTLEEKRRELEIKIKTFSDDEQILNHIAEQLFSLANYIKHRIVRISGGTTKAPGKILRVTLPDGRVICDPKATSTFIKTLRFMGLEKCSRITVVSQLEHPVVSTKPNPYKVSQQRSIKKVDGYFIETHSSTDTKAKHLRHYAKELGVKITVETIDQQER